MPHNAPLDNGVRSALEAGSTYPVVFYTEYLDLMRFPDTRHQQKLVDYLRVKYSGLRIDLIFVVSPLALNFFVERGEELFPGTPIVFTSIGKSTLERLPLKPNMTGIAVEGDIRDTLEIVLRLQPDTVRVVIPVGSSALEKNWTEQTRKSLQPLESRVAITYLTDLPMKEVLSRLRNLPPHTVVLFASLFFYDGERRYFLPEEALDLICRSSNAPVYGTERPFLGTGIVGGHVYDIAEVGVAAGKVGQRILAGEKPGDIPIQVLDPNHNIFDARQLKRWGLSEGNLPPGSVVLYRQPTAWQSYGRYILGTAFLLLAETLLILGLLWQRARRRKVETSLAERFAFETLLSDLSSTFINLPEQQIDLHIEKCLGRIASFLHLDQITLFEFSGEGTELATTSSWHSEGSDLVTSNSNPIPWPWWTGNALHRGPVTFPDARVLPDEASNVRRYLLESGIQSIASVPLGIGGGIIGAISFVSTRHRVLWTEDLVRQLKVLAEIFSNALKRKRTSQALLTSQAVLRESEERLRLAIAAAKLGVWEWDVNSGRNLWLGESHSLLGTLPADRSGLVQDFWDRVHPEDAAQLRNAVGLAKTDRSEFDHEFRCVWPDGSTHWLRSVGTFFYTPDGAPQRMLGISMDITGRKLAEQALLQRETELTEAQSLAQVGSWRWDVKTDTVSWSPELYRIAGMNPGMPAVSYKDHSKLYTAESWERLRTAVEEALRTGTPYELDLEMIRADGARRWLVARGEAHRDASGTVVQLRGTVHDITERKSTEEALRESEERLRLAQEAVHVGIFEWDIQKNKNYWSPEMERIYGLSPGLFGSTYEAWIERIHPGDREQVQRQALGHFQEAGTLDSHFRIVRPSGEIRWLFSRGTLFCDATGKPVRMLGFSIDVTDRKRAEESLRESEERLRLAIQAGKMFAYEWDATTDLIVRSAESAKILGIDEGIRLTGQQVLANVHPDERDRLKAAITALTPEMPYLEISYRIVRPDGTLIWVERNSCAHFDEHGRMLRIVGIVADVTERKRAEEAVRESEARLHLAIQAGGMYAYEWDPLTDTVIRSAECADILGKDEPLEITRRELATRVHPDDREQFAANPQSTPEHPNSQMTYRVLRHDGSVVWLEKRARAFFDDQGRMLRMIGVVADITARKHAEQALAQSQEKFSKAFRQIPMLLTISNAKDHRYIEVNETFERMTGWRRDEVIGRTAFDLGLWVDPAQRIDAVKRLLSEGSLSNLEARFCMRDGSIRIGQVSAEMIELDGQPCVLGVIADVTERKKAEEALRESETRFELVANTAPVLIWMSDTDKLRAYFNEPWLEFTGRPLESELGNGWAEGVHPEDFATCLDTYVKAFDRRENFRMEYRLRRHDGEYRWVLDIGVPRFNPDGSFAGYIGSCMDVTDRKLAEEALSSVSRKLIEAHEEERTRIARELHDDINQRLALMEIELEELGLSPPDSATEISRRAIGMRKRVSEIGIDVQTISHRLHSSKLEYLGIVAAVKSFCKELTDRQRVEVNFTHDLVPASLPQDISLSLFRVLQEALRNAVKHSGVRQFDVDLRGNLHEIQLTVHDAGVGFDLIATMTNPGLGLISMQERIRLVKGNIAIVSNPGTGTTIQATVPLNSGKSIQAVGL